MDPAHALPPLPARYRPTGPLRADGRLWRCDDVQAARPVVCRLLDAPRDGADPAEGIAIRHALWTLAQLAHPALAVVLDHGTAPDGRTWLVVPWVEAPRLSAVGALGADAVGRLLGDLLGALDCLHRHGLVHGALDATRVRVAPDGAAVLMDAGVSAAGIERRAGRTELDPAGDLRAAGRLIQAVVGPEALPARVEGVLRRLVSAAGGFASAREALAALGLMVERGEEPLPAAPLIGRTAELRRLDAALAAAAAGEAGGATVWIAGPPGVGKSRLLDAFAHEAAGAGFAFARGGGEGRGRDVPYGPIVRALRGLLPALRAHLPETLARLGPVLGRLLPELAPPDAAPAIDPPAARLRLQGAIAEAFVAMARRQGLVLAIEEADRLDPLTAETLARVARSAPGEKLLLVGAAEAADDLPDWAAGATPLILEGLDAEGLGAFAAALLGVTDPPPGLAERLAAASGGLPRAAEAALRGLIASGALRRVAGGGRTTWELGEGQPAVAADPLADLPATAAAVARRAAVLGGAADLDVLLAIAGTSEPVLFGALDTLRRAGILASEADGTIGFAQPEVAEAVRAGLAPDARQGFHRAAAEAYHARLGGRGPAEAPLATAAAIARHALAGQLSDLATTFALEAGRRFAAMHAADEAEALLAAGLARVRAEGRAAWLGRRLDFLEALADVRRVAGALDEALALYAEAERLGEALGDRRRLGRIAGSLAKVHQVRDDLPAAEAACARALALAEEAGDADGRARSLLTAARLSVYAGRAAAARERAGEALVHARADGDPARVAEALALLGYLLAEEPATRAAGVEKLQEAIGLLTGLGDPIGLNMAASMLGDAQAAGGDLEAARKSYRLARWIGLDVGVRTEAGITAINLGLVAMELGEPAEAAARAEEARRIAGELGHRFQVALADAVAAAAAAACGDVAAAIAWADAALDAAAALRNPYLDGLVRPLVLEARLRAGDLMGADAVSDAPEAGETAAAAARRLALRAEIRGRLGDLDAAATAAEEALARADAADSPVERVRARRAAAWVALACGEAEAAQRSATEARALAERLGLRLQLAAAEGLLAEATRRAGGGDPRTHWIAMATIAGDAGARWQAAEALDALAALEPGGAAATEAAKLVAAATAGATPEVRARLEEAWIVRRVVAPDADVHTPATPDS